MAVGTRMPELVGLLALLVAVLFGSPLEARQAATPAGADDTTELAKKVPDP